MPSSLQMNDDSSSSSYGVDLSQEEGSRAGASQPTSEASSNEAELTLGDYLVWAAKLGVVLTLLASTVVVSLLVFFSVRNVEEGQFEGDFRVLADKLGRSAAQKVSDLYNEMNEIAVSTSSLVAAQNDQTWPYVRLNYFERLADSFRETSHSKVLIFSPTVADQASWQDSYAARHHPEEQAIALSGDAAIPRDAIGTFNPIWEISPLPEEANFSYSDLRTIPAFIPTVQATEEFNTMVVSETILDLAKQLQVSDLPHITNEHPHSLAVQPILESVKSKSSPTVGYFVSLLCWVSFLSNILHGQERLTAVVDNTCGEAYTYDVIGPEVVYKGAGFLHDRAYEKHHVQTPFVNGLLGTAGSSQPKGHRRLHEATSASEQVDVCVFTLHIYPTDHFHDRFTSRTPLFLCFACVGVVFGVTAAAFWVWDRNNGLRQQELTQRVKKTSRIISTMFPKKIRDELLRNATQSIDGREVPFQNLEYDKKNRFAEFMDEAPTESITLRNTKPLADLYVATTIMFADICGFTAWSSVREPTHVFQLLEAIFSSFDDIARKMGVFKVETVGDCYVAVAGMPEARDDHAVLMARFAQRCQRKLDEIMEILVLNLGPDTAELSLRCGLHSGPVTAGVLRGDRARLQLFGDTMNTTSRIETSGAPKKIHVSPETAHLLQQHNKGHWLERREDLVVAKGKGAIQTYWLKIHPSNGAGGEDGTVKPEQAPAPKEDAQTKKMNHLLDWNSEILIKIVKQIVSRREQTLKSLGRTPSSWSVANTTPTLSLRLAERRMAQQTSKSSSGVIGEIAEIIPMSDRSDVADADEINAVELDPLVETQIRDLVRIISKMYRDNPFHCFEHASHVTMAVTKLLSRIRKSVGESEDQTYGITSDPLTQFALVVAALIHDVDHRGIPNGALKIEDPLLSAAYKHQSVAEQNSVDLAWNVIMDSSFVALRSCLLENEADLKRLRQLIVNSVMATDIFDKDLGALRKKRWTDAFYNSDVLKNEPAETQLHRKATIVIEHLIQASDVSHTMQHWHIYQKWNERLFAENYQSFQQGRTDKDPSSGWYKGELWFFDNYVIPLTKKLKECGVFGVSSDEYLNYATNNRNEWEKKGEGIVEKFLKKYKKEDNKDDQE